MAEAVQSGRRPTATGRTGPACLADTLQPHERLRGRRATGDSPTWSVPARCVIGSRLGNGSV